MCIISDIYNSLYHHHRDRLLQHLLIHRDCQKQWEVFKTADTETDKVVRSYSRISLLNSYSMKRYMHRYQILKSGIEWYIFVSKVSNYREIVERTMDFYY